MDYGKYSIAIRVINDQLQAIANTTANQAWSGCADDSNPMFVELMKQHARLTELSSRLNDQMLTLGVSAAQRGGLSDADHSNMDRFLGKAFDSIRDGSLSRHQFVEGLAHVMAALDNGNAGEASRWLKLDPSQFSK